MELNSKQKKHLKALAHSLKAIVQIGKEGMTERVLKELDRALTDHELVKVKIPAEDKLELVEQAEKVAKETKSSLVFTLGRVATFYRRSKKKGIDKIEIPN